MAFVEAGGVPGHLYTPQIVNFITLLLSDKTICLNFCAILSSLFSTEQGLQQGYPLCLILVLHNNADCVDACNSPDFSATGISFVENADVLAFGTSTEDTFAAWQGIQKRESKKGDMHSAYSAPCIYVLVHFPKNM